MGRKRSEVIFRQPEPERKRPVTEGVVIPGLRAVISGILITAVIVLAFQEVGGAWLSWTAAALCWAVVALVIWGLSTWRDLLWFLERATQTDLDSDGYVGDPENRYVLVNAAPPQEIEQPVDRAHKRLCQFVEAAGKSTATRDLEGQGFTRDEVQMFRGLLLRAGYAQWRSGTSKRDGWLLTRPVGVILAKIE